MEYAILFAMGQEFTLNEAQKKAVNDLDGAILVIAGAGSGKTRVLTARICHLIETGVSPYNILAITFTNKAAGEMKERIERAIGSSAVFTSTFHSLCARILRVHAERLGYSKDFSIYTEQESSRLVKRILQDYPAADPKKYGDFLWHISKAKTCSLSPDEYYEETRTDVPNADDICYVFKRYNEELKRCNSFDFDDLLLMTEKLFKECPDVLESYQRRFKYIHVDEFQDTNVLQYRIVKLLSAMNGNLFVVGDEDQSIYSWRGAEIRNILNFPKDFPGAKVYRLEQNYRSTSSILRAANNVIKHNTNRNDKTLWCENKDENSVEYIEVNSDRSEAEQVARLVAMLTEYGSSYRDCAVLVRANSLTRQIEEEFNLHGIPYKVFGGFRFFERKEIKDALAYVRLALNPSDNDSLLRVINYPKRGIGLGSVQELQEYANDRGMTYFSALLNPDGLSAAANKKLAPFTEIVMDLIKCVKEMRPAEFMQYMILRTGIDSVLSASKDADDQNRLENIRELVGAVKEFVQDNPELGISEFMQSVALVSDTDEMDDENYVTVATIHAVKGLEFENVFIIGMEEGIFPSQRAISSGDIEEERRLMYVAITRAMRKLFVLNAKSRYRFNKVEYFPKSRFVYEMTGQKPTVRIVNSDYGMKNSGRDDRKFKLGANNPSQQSFRERFGMSVQTNKNIDYDKFKKGVVVEHSKFGKGVIISTQGDGEDKIAAIEFPKLGVKRFALAIAAASLKILTEFD